MNFTLPEYFAALMLIALTAFGVFEFLEGVRRKRQYERLTRSKTYHCLRCDCVYTSHGEDESAQCPGCGYRNGRLKF